MAMLLCEVVTPTQLLFHEQAYQVEIPSVDGYFGVLPGHCMTSCRMQNGTVTIYKDADHKDKVTYVTYMGFAQVDNDKVTVLGRQAILKDDINVEAVRAERERIQAKIDQISTEELTEMKAKAGRVLRDTLLCDLEWCDVQLAACEGK
ncbi:MAG: ATP synthase F1 subunit epsilon [Coriobacteriia bacterium]|nr:ATP synthase F1 subunit epsilon [Coriobacteriia bacterium]